MKINVKELPQDLLTYADNIIKNGQDRGYVDITTSDNKVVKLPTRMFLVHVIMWEPYIKLNLPITSEQIYEIKALKDDTWAKIHTIQYRDILHRSPEIPNMVIINCFWISINNVYKFIYRNLGCYQRSFSIFSLAKIDQHPKIKAITERYMDPAHGTHVAEAKLAQMYKNKVEQNLYSGVCEKTTAA